MKVSYPKNRQSKSKAMTLEHPSPLRAAVDELKRAIAHCLGEDHQSKSVLSEIEHTIADIEQKSKSASIVTATGKSSATTGSVPASANVPSATLSLI